MHAYVLVSKSAAPSALLDGGGWSGRCLGGCEGGSGRNKCHTRGEFILWNSPCPEIDENSRQDNRNEFPFVIEKNTKNW